jgi:osmotically-inducible protein OsmY
MRQHSVRLLLAVCLTILASCSRSDQENARREAEEAKEKARRAGEHLKQDAKRLGREVRAESRKLSSDIDHAVRGTPSTESAGDKLRQGAEELRTAGREAGSKLEHAALLARVKSKLATEVGASSITNVNVDLNGNTVTLRGKVSTEEQRRLAEWAARDVDGVNQVRNHLEVEP